MTTMKHTKSPSGKTHRLTNAKGTSVTLRYTTRPQYDDQVQGDLIRKYRSETGDPSPIGMLPVHVDAALLDNGQQQPSLDYLRGYLEGLSAAPANTQVMGRMIRETREQIAAVEAAQGIPTVPQAPTYASEDRRPHSRACGIRQHSHGTGCSPDCPTCHGSAIQALATGTVTDRSLADDEPRFPRPPAAGGAASIQINQVQPPRVNRLDEGVRRVRDAERNGW